MKLSSVIPLTNPQANGNPIRTLQTIVAIDTGMNPNHSRLRPNIAGTFDNGSGTISPCIDNVGHGSCVSGLAIFGAEYVSNFRPSAKIAMIKNFELDASGRVDEIDENTIGVISDTIARYRFNSRILNLSFNCESPNPSLTRALDEIAFANDHIIVVSSGNIQTRTIDAFLDAGQQYPDYLRNQVVYFPADCRNVITVGGHTLCDSNLVPRDCPAPFSKCGLSEYVIKP
jgi:hypothetical protein